MSRLDSSKSNKSYNHFLQKLCVNSVVNNLPSDPSENEQLKPEEPLILAIQSVVATKIGALLLVGTEELAPEKQLANFGMDSMLAAEFRGTMFRVFHIDVPFATLLDKRMSVRSLGELLAKRLLMTKV
ncbi:hypothetical protein B0J14DRAFT_660095 [Halenospora varia]|nr:hypothetical protein B0J14DRAFT_660095 [Halenospora varia]